MNIVYLEMDRTVELTTAMLEPLRLPATMQHVEKYQCGFAPVAKETDQLIANTEYGTIMTFTERRKYVQPDKVRVALDAMLLELREDEGLVPTALERKTLTRDLTDSMTKDAAPEEKPLHIMMFGNYMAISSTSQVKYKMVLAQLKKLEAFAEVKFVLLRFRGSAFHHKVRARETSEFITGRYVEMQYLHKILSFTNVSLEDRHIQENLELDYTFTKMSFDTDQVLCKINNFGDVSDAKPNMVLVRELKLSSQESEHRDPVRAFAAVALYMLPDYMEFIS